MLVGKSSMQSSMCCRWTANVWSCPTGPSWRSTSSINLGRRRRSCLSARRIVSIFRTYPNLDGTRIHHCWSSLANRHRGQLTILRDRIIRRSFATPTNTIYEVNIGNNRKTNQIHTNVSASKNTHFSYWVKRQQCSLVKVMPNSGRESNAKLAASFESSTLTSCTRLNTDCNLARICVVTPGVIKTANWCAVLTFFREKATTRAPNAYESFVANVTHANSDQREMKWLMVFYCDALKWLNMVRLWQQ